MLRTVLFIFFIAATSYNLFAQELYMPRDVKQAFKNETRSADGKPGRNYWQNHGRYNISISATPPSRTIYGAEEITYFNESPDTLRRPVFKLIVNIHKPTAVRERPETPEYFTTGIHIDSFVVNGKATRWIESPYSITNNTVRLQQGIPAHDSVHFYFKWHYDVSEKSGREGMIDSTTFFLAYFYPRVAVYDDYQHWDAGEFRDALEFYNDFNDYTVNVQVPKNYLVWGTGTLTNTDAVLQPYYAGKFRSSMLSDELAHIVTTKDILAKNVTTQNDINTWQFKAVNVPDVAIALSNHYVWDASSVVVDSAANRRASVQAAYNDTAADFHYMVGFARHALSWLSNKWPGVPYPYEKTTVVQGYAGMEYPMMANDETYEDSAFSKFVAAHEIAHTYMPFYMGINETRYGFMDEGWATTFEYLLNQDDFGPEKGDEFYRQFRVNGWANDNAANEDLPIITPGENLSGGGLGNNQYGKPSLGYLAVKDMLGDNLFKKCLHEYMNRWNGKHPLPWDFFNTFNDASGKNLNWFWNNWFFSTNYIDLAIKKVDRITTNYSLVVENIGGMAAPFNVMVTYNDGTTESLHKAASVWQLNQKLVTIKLSIKKAVKSIALTGGIYVDADNTNNKWTAN